MFNSVQYVREVCRKRKIPISQLEKDCGFSNGYLNPKKMTKIPYDRAQVIAKYLGVPVDVILTGEEDGHAASTNIKPVITDEDIKFALFGGSGEVTDAMYDEVKRFIAYVKHKHTSEKE